MFRYKLDAKSPPQYLSRAEKQVPYATSVALNKTAQAVREALRKKMPEVFDRPTPYTQRSLWIRRATKQELSAEVALKDFAGKGIAASRYLWPQVHGGQRSQKRFEKSLSQVGPDGYYIPAGGAEYDAYGNISRGQIVRMMSFVEAFGEQGYRANATAVSRARRAKNRTGQDGYKRINGVVYFVSRGKGSMSGNREQHLPAGVWQKSGTHGVDVKPVLIATKKTPTYTPRLPFYETAEQVHGEVFANEYEQAFTAALRTAR